MQIPDPASCSHRTFYRVGIQRAPVAPFRLYLMTCRDCGTTLATKTLRTRREPGDHGTDEPSSPEDGDAVARPRKAG